MFHNSVTVELWRANLLVVNMGNQTAFAQVGVEENKLSSKAVKCHVT